jgi:hypothetical protein
MKKIVLSLILLVSLASCTENQRVKSFGGTGTINLPQGEKLVNVTWKEDHLWTITRPMREGDVAETYKFHEDSSFGIVQGTYNIVETK